MGLLEPMHLLILGIAIFVFFGPKRIPELMRTVGKGMGELHKGIAESKRALSEAMEEVKREPEPEPEPMKPEPKTPDHAAAEAAARMPSSPIPPKGVSSEPPTPVG